MKRNESKSRRANALPFLKREIADLCGIKVREVRSEMRLAEDLGMDSLDTVELHVAVEQKFCIEITDADGGKLLTVRDVAKHIEEKRRG